MSNAKSTRIIAIGVGVFVIGGALLFLLLRGGSSTPKHKTLAAAPTTSTTIAGAVSVSATAPTALPVLSFKIPDGMNAVAVPMDYFAGIGGYARTGDQVNVYMVFGKDCASQPQPSGVKLLLSNVKVLEVLGSAPAASGTAASYLLALSPQDAERVIFAEKFESLYFTLTTNNEQPAGTAGVTCTSGH
jgi:Flp pilus assembly protein CpaB